MDLEARDIHEKQFHDAWRGYDQEEVDDFLDQVADVLERVGRENRQLHQRIRELEETVARGRESEEMLKKTLVTAQRAAEEAIETARSKAERLISEAEDRARRRSAEADRRVEQTEREFAAQKRELDASLARLRTFESNLKMKLQGFLQDQLRSLDRLDAQAEPSQPRTAQTPRGPSHPSTPLRATPSRMSTEPPDVVMEEVDEQPGKVRSFGWRQNRS